MGRTEKTLAELLKQTTWTDDEIDELCLCIWGEYQSSPKPGEPTASEILKKIISQAKGDIPQRGRRREIRFSEDGKTVFETETDLSPDKED